LVMDSSYDGLISLDEGIDFRLNVSNNPKFKDEVTLTLTPGEKVFYRGLYYKGKVKVNVAGRWDKGFKEAIWIITSLDTEDGLRIYDERMKIEEGFRDLKGLLNLEKIMNKKMENMEKVIGLVLIAYAIGLGSYKGQDALWGCRFSRSSEDKQSYPHLYSGSKGKKWKLY